MKAKQMTKVDVSQQKQIGIFIPIELSDKVDAKRKKKKIYLSTIVRDLLEAWVHNKIVIKKDY